MLKGIRFIVTGIAFGVIMSKSEAVSWYRIQEMFHFRSFHMYGLIGSAVLLGIATVWLLKRYNIKDSHGIPITFTDKTKGWKRYLLGGSIFGLGWALTGACPGPIFVLLGQGFPVMLLVIAGALSGTYTYGVLRNRLPH